MSLKKDYQSEKKWVFAETKSDVVLGTQFSKPFERLLLSRGFKNKNDVDYFLNPLYEGLTDPMLLPGMNTAVKVIEDAVNVGERIAIYGDYDVDGVSATAVLADFFATIGVETENYIPSRFDEGYGINNEALNDLHKKGVKLIITVDCGSSAVMEIEHANSLGIKSVITDHHALKVDENNLPIVPKSNAFINCQLAENESLRNLAGVGVAFYLVRALMTVFKEKIRPGQEKWLLDLVALGTVCDIVPLTFDNRILVTYGMKVLSKTRRKGLVELTKSAEFQLSNIDSGKVGFVIGPRLNAAGRIEHARDALELLLTNSQKEAERLANRLDGLNRERQEITERIVEEAVSLIEKDGNKKPIYLLSGEDWPAGVVGIVASRLVDRYGKPMLVMEDMGEELKGSARSIVDFNIVEALASVDDQLIKYGGHSFAAGFQLNKEKLSNLEDRLIEFAKKNIKISNLRPIVNIDCIIDSSEISTQFIDEISLLEPFGRSNHRPIFALVEANILSAKLVGNPAIHLKLDVSTGESVVSGIAFGYGDKLELGLDKRYDLAFTLDINEWNQRRSAEFRLIDIRQSKDDTK